MTNDNSRWHEYHKHTTDAPIPWLTTEVHEQRRENYKETYRPVDVEAVVERL